MTIDNLVNQYSYWGEHEIYGIVSWKYEIANDDTRLGYWDWVLDKIEENKL
jgi:hypothetical protein